MRRRIGRGILLAFLLAGLAGCAATGTRGPGSDLIGAGRYDEAITQLSAETARRPTDARLWRNLGIARLKNGDASGAVKDLEHARSLNGKDLSTLFFLGRAAESVPDYGRASEAYTAYLDRKPGDAEVRTRLRETNLKKLRAEMEAAIAREREISLSAIPENTVAVMEFRNLSDATELASLGKGLSAMVTGDLAKVKRFQVVEREKIPILMNEIQLGTSTVPVRPAATSTPIESARGVMERLAALPAPNGKPYYAGPIGDEETEASIEAVRNFQRDHGLSVDGKVGPNTRSAISRAYDAFLVQGPMAVPAMDTSSVPRAGKLLGARLLVQGGYTGSLSTPLRIDAGMTESTTGEAKGQGADAGGPLAELFRMEKEIVLELLSTLNIKLSNEERDAIGRPPTRNMDAFIAWSDGLSYEDQGRLDLARQSFRRAVQLDPGFQLARTSLDGVIGTPEGFSQMEQRVFEQTLAQGEAGGAEGGSALQARLDQGTARTGWGLGPDRTGDSTFRGDQFNPLVAPAGAASGTGTVVIIGEVP